MGTTGEYLGETLLTLLAVLAVAVLVLVGAKRLGLGAASGPMQLVGRLPLDARRTIYLVRVGPTVLVVGASEAGLVKLSEVSGADVPSPEQPQQPSFASLLAGLGRPSRAEGEPQRDETFQA